MDKTGSPYIHPTDAPKTGAGGTLKMAIGTGAASAVDIAVSGVEPEDMVWFVHNMTDEVDRTSDVMAIKSGAIQLSGASTSGKNLQIGWLDRLP